MIVLWLVLVIVFIVLATAKLKWHPFLVLLLACFVTAFCYQLPLTGKTGIAVTRRYNSSNGEKREETCFIDIDFFGRTAEIANQYLRKGSKILIEGRLKLDQWQDQNGQNRSKHSISVDTMEMLGSNQGGTAGAWHYRLCGKQPLYRSR